MTGVEIVDEDDVAVDMQALAKEKSRMMMLKRNKRNILLNFRKWGS